MRSIICCVLACLIATCMIAGCGSQPGTGNSAPVVNIFSVTPEVVAPEDYYSITLFAVDSDGDNIQCKIGSDEATYNVSGLTTIEEIAPSSAGSHEELAIISDGKNDVVKHYSIIIDPTMESSIIFRDKADNDFTYWNNTGFSTSEARYHSASYSFYSGQGNWLNSAMALKSSITAEVGDLLQFYCYYSTEAYWDNAYIEISADGGASWGTIDTFTGNSGGWCLKKYDLSPYYDKNVLVRFNYQTDSYYYKEGFYVDDIVIRHTR